MKVLIIGATGMLAQPVIKHLSQNNHTLVLFSRNITTNSIPGDHSIVPGDMFKKEDLQKAIEGCDAIHLNLNRVDDYLAVKNIVEVASEKGVKLISYITGSTVCKENIWFDMIHKKYRAEREIIKSGIPYIIFHPSWFFETLKLMVRDGKAMIFGKQVKPWHWIAADDYGRMVAKAYDESRAHNKILQVYGTESFLMKDILLQYAQHVNPEIKEVKSIPIFIAKAIALFKGIEPLKYAAQLYGYFDKVKEPAVDSESAELLGKPPTDFNTWLEAQKPAS